MDSLRRLPAGAAYTKKSGNTRVTASIKDDSLHVEAETDNNPELEYREEEGLVHVRDELSESETIKEPASAPLWDRLKHGLAGVLTGIALGFIFNLWRNHKS